MYFSALFIHFLFFIFKYLASNNCITPMFMRGRGEEIFTNKEDKRREPKRENENDRERDERIEGRG